MARLHDKEAARSKVVAFTVWLLALTVYELRRES
jgi:hypothetical protein